MLKVLRSRTRNLAIGYIAALGFAAMGLAALGYVQARDALVRDLDIGIEKRMQELEKAYRTGGLNALENSIAQFSERGARTFAYLLVDPNARRVTGIKGILAQAPGWSIIPIYDSDDRSMDPARILTVRLNDGSRLAVLADQDYIERFDETLVRLFAFGAILFMVLAAAGGLAIETMINRRLAPMNKTASAISTGSLSHRVPIGPSDDEFDQIGRVFNAMVDRLDTLIAETQRTSSFIAHDLRAPLIKLHDDLSRDLSCCTDAKQCIESLSAARERSSDVISLFDAILRISRAGDGFFIYSVVNLSPIVASLAESYGVVADETGGKLSFDSVSEGIMVRADAHLLTQLVVNLLDNSVRYTPAGGRITVSLFQREGCAFLEIENDMTDPHAKRQDANGSHTTSTFGLALVRAIATAHNGRIETANIGKRFRATAMLPIAPDEI
jgi:signal transduction histidine kinase